MHHMVLNLRVKDPPVIQLIEQRVLKQTQIHVLHMEYHLEVIAELCAQAGREEEPVDHKHKKHGCSYIEHSEFKRHGLRIRQCCHRQGENSYKECVYACSRRRCVHTRYHGGCKQQVFHCSLTERKDKDKRYASNRSSDEPCFHPVIAILIHGPKKQKRIHHKPVSVISLEQHII